MKTSHVRHTAPDRRTDKPRYKANLKYSTSAYRNCGGEGAKLGELL